MAYAPTTWIEDVTTLGPTNFNKLELGLQAAALVADNAIPKPIAVADDILYYDAGTSSWKARKLVNVDVAAGAGIAKTKLANLDVVNADVNAAAAIALSKIAGVAEGYIIAGQPGPSGLLARGGMSEIASLTLGGVGTFDFTALSAVYFYFLICYQLRSSSAVVTDDVWVRLNNDATANYDDQVQVASAAAVTASEDLAATKMRLGACPGASAPANLFSTGTILIPNIFGERLAQGHCSCKVGVASGNLSIRQFMGAWRSTAVINRIQIFPAVTFTASSNVQIFGITA